MTIHRLLFLLMIAVSASADIQTTLTPPGISGGIVKATTIWNDELIVTGSFRYAQGVLCPPVARFDGVNFHPLGQPAPGFQGRTLLVRNNTLLIAGSGTSLLDGCGPFLWQNDRWQPLAPGLNGEIHKLIEYQGNLVALGKFSCLDNSAIHNCAIWNRKQWLPLGSFDFDPLAVIRDAAVYGNNLIVAGSFTSITNTDQRNIVRWDGSSWHAMGAGTDDEVRTLLNHGGLLYVGGRFLTAGDQKAVRVAAWNGESWSSCGDGIGVAEACKSSEVVHDLIVHDGQVLAGGRFRTSKLNTTGNLMSWDGSFWSRYHRSPVIGCMVSTDADLMIFSKRQNSVSGISTWVMDANGGAPAGQGNMIFGMFHKHNTHLQSIDDQLFALGQFGFAGHVQCSGLALWNGHFWMALPGWNDHVTHEIQTAPSSIISRGDSLLVRFLPTHSHSSRTANYVHFDLFDGQHWTRLDPIELENGLLIGSSHFYQGSILVLLDQYKGLMSTTQRPDSRLIIWRDRHWSPFPLPDELANPQAISVRGDTLLLHVGNGVAALTQESVTWELSNIQGRRFWSDNVLAFAQNDGGHVETTWRKNGRWVKEQGHFQNTGYLFSLGIFRYMLIDGDLVTLGYYDLIDGQPALGTAVRRDGRWLPLPFSHQDLLVGGVTKSWHIQPASRRQTTAVMSEIPFPLQAAPEASIPHPKPRSQVKRITEFETGIDPIITEGSAFDKTETWSWEQRSFRRKDFPEWSHQVKEPGRSTITCESISPDDVVSTTYQGLRQINCSGRYRLTGEYRLSGGHGKASVSLKTRPADPRRPLECSRETTQWMYKNRWQTIDLTCWAEPGDTMSVSLRLEPREKGLKLETRNVHLLPEDGFRREQFRNLVDELAAGANVWFEPKNGWRTGIDSLLNNDHQCSLRGFRIEISSLRDSRIRTKFDRDWSQIHDTHGYSLGALNCHPELLAIDNSNRPTLARTIDGLLYCRFGEYFEMSSEAIPVIAKSSALIIDLRIARNAMLKPLNKDFRNDLEKAVGLLTTKTTPYCTLKRSDWRRWFDPHYHWKVRPNKEGPGAIPVVVLIDDRTGPRYGLLALMLSSLENVRLVGQPTKGVEGPYRYHLLPDGLSVAMPSQPVMTMGGRNASLNGIVPDVVVEHGNHKEGDPVFERGLVELREMIQNTLKQSEE